MNDIVSRHSSVAYSLGRHVRPREVEHADSRVLESGSVGDLPHIMPKQKSEEPPPFTDFSTVVIGPSSRSRE